MSYDPAFLNSASCQSAITFIDGERGILRYRGYPIEQLAEQSNYMEVAYLLVNGELPTKAEYDDWVDGITHHSIVHENMKEVFHGFHHDAHPMPMLISTLAALSTFYPASRNVMDPEVRKLQMYRLLGKVTTLAAMAYRHTKGLPYVMPDNDLSYVGNFMNMLWRMAECRYTPNPTLEKALDVLFILHADHEQNCSTNTMRIVASAESDPYCAAAAAAAALYGPLHGGANEAVLTMLRAIGSKEKVPQFIRDVKDRKALLMGFGHRVYKNYDPRAKVIKRLAEEVFDVTGRTRSSSWLWSWSGSPSRMTTSCRGSSSPMLTSTRDHLRGHGDAQRVLHRRLRGPAHVRLAGPVAGDDPGRGAEDRAAASGLHGGGDPGLTSRSRSAPRSRRASLICPAFRPGCVRRTPAVISSSVRGLRR